MSPGTLEGKKSFFTEMGMIFLSLFKALVLDQGYIGTRVV